MSTFLGLLGMLAFFVGIILVIISFIKKKPKRNPLIIIAAGLVLFIIGVSLSDNSTSSESTKTASTSIVSSKKTTNKSSSKAKASSEAAKISKSKEAEIKASKAKIEAAKQAEIAKQAEEARQAEASRQAEAQSISASQSMEADASKQAEVQRQAEAQAAVQQAQANVSTTEDANNRTVYVVNNGTTKVYWYNESAIHPKPTHPVIPMTEGEALARDLHHSQTE